MTLDSLVYNRPDLPHTKYSRVKYNNLKYY